MFTTHFSILISPTIVYNFWGNNYARPLSHIVKLQNRAIRIINDVPLEEHITPHYLNLGLLRFPDLAKLLDIPVNSFTITGIYAMKSLQNLNYHWFLNNTIILQVAHLLNFCKTLPLE